MSKVSEYRALRKCFSDAQKRIIAKNQNYLCPGVVCQNTKLLPSSWQLDHIIPLHKGGTNYYDFSSGGPSNPLNNVHILCAGCHALKTQQEMIEMYAEERVRKYTQPVVDEVVVISPFFDKAHAKYIPHNLDARFVKKKR